jgi:ATP-dependent Lhr-like helicase
VRTTAGRLIAAEDLSRYASDDIADWLWILERYVSAHAGSTSEEMLRRYPGMQDAVDALAQREELARLDLPGRPGAWLHRDVLVGLRRLTLSQRRTRSRAVPLRALAAAVIRRQGLVDPLGGPDGPRRVLEQLAGWQLPVGLWSDVLAARIAGAASPEIDPLIRGGEFEWRGSRIGATRVVAFSPPGMGAALLPAPSDAPLEEGAGRIVDYLTTNGASFAHQIASACGIPLGEVEAALWDLIWLGRVSNDSFRAIVRPRRTTRRRPLGRWAVPASRGARDRETEIDAALRVLLSRYGFLCRELVDRERIGVRWSEAYPALTRMEWRGEVERGLFVSGLSGAQFADRVGRDELLRVAEKERPVLLQVNDPANLFGDVVPIVTPAGDRWVVRHHPGNYLVVRGGDPMLAIEGGGARLTSLRELRDEERRPALELLRELVRRPDQPASLHVESWDGRAVIETPVAADLAALGFVREDRVMILYRSFGGGG